MTRLKAVMVAAGLSVGAVGCAHCDTCDDFPAPCVGPNCATGPMGAYGMASGPSSYSGPMTAGTTVPATAPGATAPAAPAGASLGGSLIDSAGPAPGVPGTTPAPAPSTPSTSPFEARPAAPAGNSPSPPQPGDPAARTRPGS